MTDTHRRWVDKGLIALIVVLAAFLRRDLNYRTAFVDEAITAVCGWRILSGQPSGALNSRMGWPLVSCLPLGALGVWGDVTWMRGANAVLGVLTVLLAVFIARRIYGRVAGYIAGGIWAVYGPAIFISTLGHSDALSLLLASVGISAWVLGAQGGVRAAEAGRLDATSALTDAKPWYYLLGSLSLVLAVLVKYAAVMVVLLGSLYAALALVVGLTHLRTDDPTVYDLRVQRKLVPHLVLLLGPLLLLPLYGVMVRRHLLVLWQAQVLSKQLDTPDAVASILGEFWERLWPLLVLSVGAFLPLRRGRRKGALVWSGGLLTVGLAMLLYHLLNQDKSTLYKFTNYMLIGLAPLAAGAIVTVTEALLRGGMARWRGVAAGAVGLLLVLFLGVRGQRMLPGLRSFWSDMAPALAYLRAEVLDGDVLLMEGGQVGSYYLIVKGAPGHVPERILDTWWYQDEEGSGEEAFKRGIRQRRFDWVILDDVYTEQFNRVLLSAMEGHYELAATFPARRFGHVGQVRIYRAQEANVARVER